MKRYYTIRSDGQVSQCRHGHRQSSLEDGLYMKQAEVHGMSQRGGDVQSNLRIVTNLSLQT